MLVYYRHSGVALCIMFCYTKQAKYLNTEGTVASYHTFKNSGRCRALIRRKSIGNLCKTFASEEEARAWAEGEEARLLRHVLAAPAAQAGGITLREAWAGYQDSPAYRKKAASTQRREGQAAIPVLRSIGGYSLGSVDRIRLQHYFDRRSKEKSARGVRLSGATLHREKEFLSAVFKWAIRRGYATTNPARSELELPELHVREARISIEQEAKMYDEAWAYIEYKKKGHPPNPNLFPWFQFVMGTGTRPGEAAKIELAWVNLKNREIHIPRAGHKTRRPRVILLAPDMAKMVSLQVDYATEQGSKYLFFSQRDGKFKPYSYAKPWRTICRRAGVPDEVVPHSSRHELISRLFEKTDLSDSQVAVLVGDVHPLSLKPYTHLRANTLRPKFAEFEKAISAVKGEHYQRERAEAEAKELLRKLSKKK